MNKDNICVGLELEFSNEVTHGWTSDPANKKDKDVRDKEVSDIIRPWKELLYAKAKNSKDEITVSDPKGRDKWLLRVSYKKEDRDGTEHSLTWDITTDISVIEVIIQKAPFKYYNFFRKLIQEHIYNFAKKVGLEVVTHGNYMSMTHINIDFETGFSSNFKSVLKYIIGQEKAYKKTTNISLTINAHCLNEVLSHKAYKNKMKAAEDLLKKDTVKYRDIEELMTIETRSLKDFLEGLELDDNIIKMIISRPLHYQFTNIEHLKEKEPDQQRIEDRRHEGKKSFQDTFKDVDDVLDYLIKVVGDPPDSPTEFS